MENGEAESVVQPESGRDLLSGGKQLQQARENQSLSVDQVATELHLTPYQIQALEAEDFSRLPEATYICGYVRNYARFLGLDSDALLHSYPNLDDVLQQSPVVSETRITREDISASPSGFPLPLIVVVLLIAVAGGWYFIGGGEDTDLVKVSSPTDKKGTAGEQKSTGVVSQDLPSSETVIANATEALTKPENENQARTVEDEAVVEPDAVDSSQQKSVIVEKSVAEIEPTPAPAAAVAEATPAALEPSSELVPGSKLLIRFSLNSWTDVTDAEGKQLVYRLSKAGTSVSVIGVAPFRAFFGYVPGVEIELNGQSVDMSRYELMEKANLKVGDDSSNSMIYGFRPMDRPRVETRKASASDSPGRLPASQNGLTSTVSSTSTATKAAAQNEPADEDAEEEAVQVRTPKGGRSRPAPITNLFDADD